MSTVLRLLMLYPEFPSLHTRRVSLRSLLSVWVRRRVFPGRLPVLALSHSGAESNTHDVDEHTADDSLARPNAVVTPCPSPSLWVRASCLESTSTHVPPSSLLLTLSLLDLLLTVCYLPASPRQPSETHSLNIPVLPRRSGMAHARPLDSREYELTVR